MRLIKLTRDPHANVREEALIGWSWTKWSDAIENVPDRKRLEAHKVILDLAAHEKVVAFHWIAEAIAALQIHAPPPIAERIKSDEMERRTIEEEACKSGLRWGRKGPPTPSVVPRYGVPRCEAFRGQALRPSLEGLGQEVGKPDLPGRRGAEGDGAWDARAPLDARRRKWRLRSRGGRLTRSRIERDHDAELREAGGGSGGSAATGDDRPQRRPTRLLI